MRSISLSLILIVGLSCKQVIASMDDSLLETAKGPVTTEVTNNIPFISQAPITNITISNEPGFFPDVWTYKKFYGVLSIGVIISIAIFYYLTNYALKQKEEKEVFESFSRKTITIKNGAETNFADFKAELLNNSESHLNELQRKINIQEAASVLPAIVESLNTIVAFFTNQFVNQENNQTLPIEDYVD